MIKCLVKKPTKLSGLQSVYISSSGFSQALVDLMHRYSPAIWNKTNGTWEISVKYLGEVLDALTKLDDIELTIDPCIIGDRTVPLLTEEEIADFKVELLKHQLEAINYGLQHDKWLLLDGCGVGKTLEIIGLAETLHRRGKIDHCLIICGVNSLKLNWEREIQKFSNETCRVLGKRITRTGSVHYTTIKERAEELKNEISEFFIITNIETLRADSVIQAISKSKNNFGLIAVDEIHKCNNAMSQQGSNLLKLKADYKIGATGTLLTNSALSCYGPLKFIEMDNSTLTNYKALYCEFGSTAFTQYQIVGYKNLDVLREEIDSCSLRRTLSQVRNDIPKLQIDFELIEMDDADRKFYDAIKAGVKEEADKIDLKPNNMLSLVTRLRQATADPEILTTEKIESSKLTRCKELVEEIVSQGEKVVVFSNFKQPLHRLAKMLEDYKPTVNTGDMADSIISLNVQSFQNDPDSKVFLATGAKMGTGHTLNAAMYLIFLDIPWTWSEFDQQYSRVYRVTNTRPALIKVLGDADTIDERVWEIVNNKKDVADYLVDGKISRTMAADLKSIINNL